MSPIGFHPRSPEYALKRAHMRDNFLCDTRVSQFGLFLWCANLTAFFCTLSNALFCPSLYGSQHAYGWIILRGLKLACAVLKNSLDSGDQSVKSIRGNNGHLFLESYETRKYTVCVCVCVCVCGRGQSAERSRVYSLKCSHFYGCLWFCDAQLDV